MDFKRFVVLTLLFFIILRILPLYPLQLAVAGLAYNLVLAIGVDAELNGDSIITSNQFYVSPDCTGIISIAIVLALLLSTILRLQTRVLFSLLACIIFPIWNAVRIAVSIAVSKNFELVHFSLWIVSFVFILGIYLLAIWYDDRTRRV